MASEFSKFRWHELAMRLTRGRTAQVAGIMFDRASMDGTEVYINNEKLARELGCNEKTIRRARKDIESKGLAQLVRLGHNMVDGSSRTSSEYRLTMPTQPDIAQPDKPQVTPQPDIEGSTTGHLPHNRTSVSPQPDKNVHLIDPGNKPGSSTNGEPDTDVSGSNNRTSGMSGDAPRPVGEGQEQSEPALVAVSSSTAIGTSSDVPQPDTVVSGSNRTSAMSGGSDPQPATERETMNRTDPWAANATDEDYYGAIADAHFASMRREDSAGLFQMPVGAFVGPDTDPATGGPNWDQGPLQLP